MARNCAPGWNDPPSLTYNPSKPTGSVRSLLNKRVAFPVNSSAGGSDNSIMTPNPNPHLATHGSETFYNATVHNNYVAGNSVDHFNRSASTPCFSQPFEQSVSSPNNFSTVPPVPAVQQNYDLNNRGQSPPQYSAWDIINIVQGAAIGCVNMPKATRANVDRRIAALKISLETNCLSSQCYSKLCALVDDLSKQRYNDAYNVHSVMMIEHFNEVNSWMVGVKAIIMEYLKH